MEAEEAAEAEVGMVMVREGTMAVGHKEENGVKTHPAEGVQALLVRLGQAKFQVREVLEG